MSLKSPPNKNSMEYKLELTVFERLMLSNVLPKEGDFVTLKLVRKLREALSFGEEEIATINFQNLWRCPQCKEESFASRQIKCDKCKIYCAPVGQVTWDEAKAKEIVKDVHMGSTMQTLCVATLQKLSAEKKLTDQYYSLFEKFCGEGAEGGE